MKKVVFSFTAALIALFCTTGMAAAYGPSSAGTTGVDVGWPNCNTGIPTVTFGIVGVSDSQGYSTNPCLAKEARSFGNLSLYASAGW